MRTQATINKRTVPVDQPLSRKHSWAPDTEGVPRAPLVVSKSFRLKDQHHRAARIMNYENKVVPPLMRLATITYFRLRRPQIVDLWDLNGPRPPQNALEKVGAELPIF